MINVMRGKLIIISAPSGTGKSTIIGWLMKEHPELNLAFSISCTSRPPRGTEQNGVEYFFLTPEEFRQRIENDEFLFQSVLVVVGFRNMLQPLYYAAFYLLYS